MQRSTLMSPWRASLIVAVVAGCREPSKSMAEGSEPFEPFCIPAPELQGAPFDSATRDDWSLRCEFAPSRSRTQYAAVYSTPDGVLLRIDDEDYIANPGYLSDLQSFASAVGLGLWSRADPILPDPDGTTWTLETRANGRVRTYERQNQHEPRLLDVCALMGLNERSSRSPSDEGTLNVLSETSSQLFEWPTVVWLRVSCPRANSAACRNRVTELLKRPSCAPSTLQECVPGPTHAVITALGPESPVPTLCTWHSELTPNGWRHSSSPW